MYCFTASNNNNIFLYAFFPLGVHKPLYEGISAHNTNKSSEMGSPCQQPLLTETIVDAIPLIWCKKKRPIGTSPFQTHNILRPTAYKTSLLSQKLSQNLWRLAMQFGSSALYLCYCCTVGMITMSRKSTEHQSATPLLQNPFFQCLGFHSAHSGDHHNE